MHENKDCVENPSQVSGSGSPSVLLHSPKLRIKLEKLARWRIDPSLIELPPDAREFCGGFATVSQGLLTSPSRNEGGANESERITGEHHSSEAGRPRSFSSTQEPGEKDQSMAEEADSRMVKGEKRKGDNEEQNFHDKTSIQESGFGSAWLEHAVNGSPDLGDRNSQSQSDIQEPGGDRQGKAEGANSRIVGGDHGQTKEGMRRDPENAENEEHPDCQAKVVAVKKLNIEEDTDFERALGLALKESEVLVELSHPNIVKLEGYVADLSEKKVWLIFPWEERGNLKGFLASGEWEIPERISLFDDVARGLEYLHNRDPPIYHGDLKSLNILVNSECIALITDFGSARHLARDVANQPQEDEHQARPVAHPPSGEEQITLETSFTATASTLILSGSGFTIRWAAPEVLRGDEPSLRSDIWALGWIAYEVMTNSIPFHDLQMHVTVILRVIQGRLPSVTDDARMSLIRALCSLIMQCWSINPEERPTAEECRKSISWMPKIVPAPAQTIDREASELRHAQLLTQLGGMYSVQADYPNALSCFTGALDIYTNHNNNQGRASSLRNLADTHRFQGGYTEALTFYSKALEMHADSGDESERTAVMFGLASTHMLRHEYGEAGKLYSECLQFQTDAGSERDRAIALGGLADVHRLRDEFSDAIKFYSEALQIHTDVGDRREKAFTLHGLADVHRMQKEYSEAIDLYSKALRLCTDIGDQEGRARIMWYLAEVYRLREEYTKAIELYSDVQQIYADIGDHHGRARVLWDLAGIHRLQEEHTEAINLYSESLQICTEFGDRHGTVRNLWDLAQVHRLQEEYAVAIELYSEALQVDISDYNGTGRNWWDLSQVHRLQEEYTEVIKIASEFRQIPTEVGEKEASEV